LAGHWLTVTGHTVLLLTSHHQTPLILLFKQHELHLIILESMVAAALLAVWLWLHAISNLLGHLSICIVVGTREHSSIGILHRHKFRLIRHNAGIHHTAVRKTLGRQC
jgi:hypothetical protein